MSMNTPFTLKTADDLQVGDLLPAGMVVGIIDKSDFDELVGIDGDEGRRIIVVASPIAPFLPTTADDKQVVLGQAEPVQGIAVAMNASLIGASHYAESHDLIHRFLTGQIDNLAVQSPYLDPTDVPENMVALSVAEVEALTIAAVERHANEN